MCDDAPGCVTMHQAQAGARAAERASWTAAQTALHAGPETRRRPKSKGCRGILTWTDHTRAGLAHPCRTARVERHRVETHRVERH
eukprot:210239-Chlamydomonas_euryale.AAC.1